MRNLHDITEPRAYFNYDAGDVMVEPAIRPMRPDRPLFGDVIAVPGAAFQDPLARQAYVDRLTHRYRATLEANLRHVALVNGDSIEFRTRIDVT